LARSRGRARRRLLGSPEADASGRVDRSTSFISWGEVRADLPYLISVDHHGDIRAREVRWPTRHLSVVTCRETGVTIALNASRDVRSFIRAGGGRVFLWLEPPGAPLVGSRASLRPPNVPVFFDEFDASDFTLHVEHGFEPPQGVRLDLRRFPRRSLVVSTGFERYGRESAINV